MNEKELNEVSNHFKNITKTEFKHILAELKEMQIDYKAIDFYAFGDDCNYEMLVQNIFVEYGVEVPFPDKTQTESQTESQNHSEKIYKNDMAWWDSIIKDIKSVAVVGDTGTGKTAFCYRLLERYRKTKKDIYVYKHPKPKIIEKLGYKILHSLEEFATLQNAVVWIDEPQLVLRYYSNNGNPALARLLSLARQRNVALILSTSVTQYISRLLEGQIDAWSIKDLDYDTAKQGSRVRKIIKRNALFDPDAFKLKPEEYLFYCRKHYDKQGRYEFSLPKYWSDEYSKPYMGVK